MGRSNEPTGWKPSEAGQETNKYDTPVARANMTAVIERNQVALDGLGCGHGSSAPGPAALHRRKRRRIPRRSDRAARTGGSRAPRPGPAGIVLGHDARGVHRLVAACDELAPDGVRAAGGERGEGAPAPAHDLARGLRRGR